MHLKEPALEIRTVERLHSEPPPFSKFCLPAFVKSLQNVCNHHLLSYLSLEKEMATHSSILAWKIPGTEEPGRLQSMGSQGVDMTE